MIRESCRESLLESDDVGVQMALVCGRWRGQIIGSEEDSGDSGG